MTLPVTQSFLPLVTPDNRILGIQAISTTTFQGTEKDYPPATPGNPTAFLTGGTLGAMTLSQLQALSGTLIVTVDGTVETSSTISLSAATSFPNAATIIQAAFSGGVPVVTYQSSPVPSFVLSSKTTGSGSTIGYATGTLSAGIMLTSATGAVITPYAAPTAAGTLAIQLYSPAANLGLPPQQQVSVNYMGIPVTFTQERQSNYGPGWLQPFIPYTKWRQSPGFARYDWKGNSLLELLQGQSVDAISAPGTGTVTASNGALSIVWALDFNTSDTYAFFDANWVSLFKASSGNTNAASISVGNPTSDPSNGMVKVFLINTYPVIVNQSVLFSTIRFVKITNDNIPTGNYIWPATISNTDGSTAAVTLTLTII